MPNAKPASLYKKILSLGMAVLVIALIAGGVSVNYLTYHEVIDISENSLENIANIVLNQAQNNDFDDEHEHFSTDSGDGGVVIDLFEVDIDLEDIAHPVSQSLLARAPAEESVQRINGESWLVYRRDTESYVVVVRERLANHQELAQMVAISSVIPLVAAMLSLLVLLALILWRAFLPLNRLSQTIKARADHDLSPIATASIPSEVSPLVDAINGLLHQSKLHLQKQQRFIADASHELRSPLTAMSLQIQRLLKSTANHTHPDIEAAHAQVIALSHSVKRNQDMVNELLTMARLNGGEIGREQVVINSLVSDTVNLLLPIIDDKSLALEIINLDAPSTILADDTVMMLVIKNLIQNAVNYTPVGGMITVISAKWGDARLHALGRTVIGDAPRRGYTVFQVIDTGVGISESDYDKVFDAFVRLSVDQGGDSFVGSSSSKERSDVAQGGTGLGLAMVKNICAELGISISMSPSQDPRYNESAMRGLCISLAWRQ